MSGLVRIADMIVNRAIASLADDAQFSKSETAWVLMPFAGWVALIITGAPQ